MVIWSSSQVNDETEDDQADDGDDLDRREPEFAFTERTRAKEVDQCDDDKANSDPNGVLSVKLSDAHSFSSAKRTLTDFVQTVKAYQFVSPNTKIRMTNS